MISCFSPTETAKQTPALRTSASGSSKGASKPGGGARWHRHVMRGGIVMRGDKTKNMPCLSRTIQLALFVFFHVGCGMSGSWQCTPALPCPERMFVVPSSNLLVGARSALWQAEALRATHDGLSLFAQAHARMVLGGTASWN